MKEELSCIVTGLVQGVGFRWFVHRQAMTHRLTGWVRNNVDGSVELVAQGPKDELHAFLGSLRKGPRSAMVKDVTVEWTSPSQEYHSFEIR